MLELLVALVLSVVVFMVVSTCMILTFILWIALLLYVASYWLCSMLMVLSL